MNLDDLMQMVSEIDQLADQLSFNIIGAKTLDHQMFCRMVDDMYQICLADDDLREFLEQEVGDINRLFRNVNDIIIENEEFKIKDIVLNLDRIHDIVKQFIKVAMTTVEYYFQKYEEEWN